MHRARASGKEQHLYFRVQALALELYELQRVVRRLGIHCKDCCQPRTPFGRPLLAALTASCHQQRAPSATSVTCTQQRIDHVMKSVRVRCSCSRRAPGLYAMKSAKKYPTPGCSYGECMSKLKRCRSAAVGTCCFALQGLHGDPREASPSMHALHFLGNCLGTCSCYIARHICHI
jgi:hypothetical protein